MLKVLGQRLPGGPPAEIIGVLAPGLQLMFPPAANVEQRPDCCVAHRPSYDNAVFLVIAVVSSWLPARRAAGLDVTSALRQS